MLYGIILPSRGALQTIHKDGAFAYEIPVFDLNSTYKDSNPGKHAQRPAHWQQSICSIFVVERELNATRRWFPEALIYEPEPNHAAIWTKCV